MKLSHRLLCVVAGGVLMASCASAPAPKTAASAPEKAPTKQAVAAPNAELQQAKTLKAQIDKYGLSSELPDAYQQGVAALSAGEKAIGTDNVTAKTKLDEAVAAFKKVVDAGFPKIVQEREQQVAAARKQAKAAKADIAAASIFNQAQSDEQQAEDKKKSDDYPAAYDLLGQALAQYKSATEEANKQLAAAEDALKQADAQLVQTKSAVAALQKTLNENKSQSTTATASASGGGQ